MKQSHSRSAAQTAHCVTGITVESVVLLLMSMHHNPLLMPLLVMPLLLIPVPLKPRCPDHLVVRLFQPIWQTLFNFLM